MTEQAISKESKSILARLLATENLIVEHKKVATANFNPESRVLILPIWKHMSGNIYDCLVGHEVGHALYSPLFEGWIDEGLPVSWVNAVEDARIEKLMRRKYPGLSHSFFRGYDELNKEIDVFKIQGKDISKFSLIDRINLHYKCIPFVPFTEQEKVYVEMVSKCETFEDVLSTVRALIEYCKENEEQLDQEEINATLEDGEGDCDLHTGFAHSSESNDKKENKGDSELESSSDSEDAGESESENENDSEEYNQGYGSNNTSDYSPKEAETDLAWNEKQSELIDESVKDHIYLTIPKIDMGEAIVTWKEYNSKLTKDIFTIQQNYSKSHYYNNALENRIQEYLDFKKNSIKSVNYLVKEFEMRKSADEYKRSSIAKTGVINTNNIHSYKWNEDIFKKLTITPGAKNHGLIFFLDWSGSMAECIKNTTKQLYNLIWFCKKVNIPFEVYSFSESEYNRHCFGKRIISNRNPNEILYQNSIRINQLFDSKMNTIQIEDQMKKIWLLVSMLNLFSSNFGMGGTPLNEAIIATKEIVKRFQNKNKVQKLNLVYLTDGESNPLYFCGKTGRDSYYFGNWVPRTIEYYIRDNNRTYKINKYDSFKQTEVMFEWLKDNVNANVIGYRLCNDREVRQFIYRKGIDYEKIQKEWKAKNSYSLRNSDGYDQFYLIRNNSNLGEDTKEIVVDENASKTQIRRAFSNHMKSKGFNKIILQKFAQYIA